MDLIDDPLNLQGVIVYGANHTHRVVEAVDVGDFWSVEIFDAVAGRAVHEVVSGMFVGPCGVATRALDHLENRVASHRTMRKQWYTLALLVDMTRQFRGINHVLRDTQGIVEIDTLVENHQVASLAGAGSVGGIENGAIVAHVVKQPMADGRSTGYQRQQARERIRVRGCPRIRIGDPVGAEGREC